LILIVLVILLAKLYPPLGAQYLAPDITATWLAVVFIFFLAGLELKTQEFRSAIVKQWHFNAFLQIYNFGVVSAIVYGITRGLESIGILSGSLAKGMVICGCLPLTISMVVVLTKAGNGDEAAAVFNSAFGNLLGVFVSPILILGYLGVDTNLDLWDVFYKLMLRVLVPIVVGQVVQKSVPAVVQFVQAHKPWFKQSQQYLLVFIVYTVFCETFQDDNENDDTSVQDIFIMSKLPTCRTNSSTLHDLR
jgi:sodium/bile acid cotransporter 7